MKDIELPPLPEPTALGMDFDKGWDGVRAYGYTKEDMASYARAAIEADRAQRVSDGWKLVPVEPTKEMLHCGPEPKNDAEKFAADMAAGYRKDIWTAMLASTPAQPAQQEPDCPRCNGSGEDPEGYFDQSRGPDGDTHDGPCRDCAGTGAAPQPVERKPMTDEVVREGFAACGVGGINARLGFVEGVKFTERHHGIRE